MKQTLRDVQRAMYAADINLVLPSNDVGMPDTEMYAAFICIGNEYRKYALNDESREEFLEHAYAHLQYGILWSVNDKKKYDKGIDLWKKGKGAKPQLLELAFPELSSIKSELFKTALMDGGRRMAELIKSNEVPPMPDVF